MTVDDLERIGGVSPECWMNAVAASLALWLTIGLVTGLL